MSTIICPECKARGVDKDAVACPSCGYPIKKYRKRSMIEYISIASVILILLIIGLAEDKITEMYSKVEPSIFTEFTCARTTYEDVISYLGNPDDTQWENTIHYENVNVWGQEGELFVTFFPVSYRTINTMSWEANISSERECKRIVNNFKRAFLIYNNGTDKSKYRKKYIFFDERRSKIEVSYELKEGIYIFKVSCRAYD